MKNRWVVYLSFMVLTLQVSCDSIGKKSNKEVLKDLLKNEEIKSSDLSIRNMTNNESGISLMGGGDKDEEGFVYYQLGFSSEERFETYYHVRFNTTSEKYEMQDLATSAWIEIK